MEKLLTYWPLIICVIVVALCGVTDLRKLRIYDWLTIPAIIVGLVGHGIYGGLMGDGGRIGLFGSLCGLLVCMVPLILLWRIGGIGGGDVKLMGAVGALLGWQGGLDVMFAAFIAAAIMAMVIILRRKIAKKTFANAWRVFRTDCFSKSKLARMADAENDSEDEQGAQPAEEKSESPQLPFAVAVVIGLACVMIMMLIR